MRCKKQALAVALALGICLGLPVCTAKSAQPQVAVATEAEVEAASREEVFKRAAELSQQADAAWKKVSLALKDKKVSKKERKRLTEEARRLNAEARPWNTKRDEYLAADNAKLKALADEKNKTLGALPLETPEIYDLKLDTADYQQYTLQVDGQPVAFRAYENLTYVAQPTDAEHQQMSIYIPEGYFKPGSKVKVNGYRRNNAPIFLPNGAEDYAPAAIQAPAEGAEGANVSLRALAHGYVVAAPALRGRRAEVDAEGHFVVTAIDPLVDYKAAVRYLRHNQHLLPAGNTEIIIASGAGVGGTLSVLLGTTGNHPDYEPFLLGQNAASCRDDVAAAQCFAPLVQLVNYGATQHPSPDYRAAAAYLKFMEPQSYIDDVQARKAYVFSMYPGPRSSDKELDRLAAKLKEAGAWVELADSGLGNALYMEEFFTKLDKFLQQPAKKAPKSTVAAEPASKQKTPAVQESPAEDAKALEQELAGVR